MRIWIHLASQIFNFFNAARLFLAPSNESLIPASAICKNQNYGHFNARCPLRAISNGTDGESPCGGYKLYSHTHLQPSITAGRAFAAIWGSQFTARKGFIANAILMNESPAWDHRDV